MVWAARERRTENRMRSLLGAHIRIALHDSKTTCLIRDRSPDGFRLALSDGVPLPETFEIHVHRTCQWQRVRLIWRGDDLVGVRFVQVAPPAVPVPIDLMRDLRAARAEIVSLRTRLTRQSDAG